MTMKEKLEAAAAKLKQFERSNMAGRLIREVPSLPSIDTAIETVCNSLGVPPDKRPVSYAHLSDAMTCAVLNILHAPDTDVTLLQWKQDYYNMIVRAHDEIEMYAYRYHNVKQLAKLLQSKGAFNGPPF